MKDHPDKEFAAYITSGIEQGFRLGYQRREVPHLQQASGNMSTPEPEIVTSYLDRETSLGRMGRVKEGSKPTRNIHISPMGMIPKKNRPGKWRLIVDLSSPKGASVNDGISAAWSSLAYSTVDHLAEIILSMGRGAHMVKADIKEAYRMVPVHPADRDLLGVRWGKEVFVDRVLPFGLRSAPKIFSAVADAAQWILCQQGVSPILHYLDDFIWVSKSHAEAAAKKERVVATCKRLGIPLEPIKLVGPTTCLPYLGIEVDTEAMQLRLPLEKLSKLRSLLDIVAGKKAMSKRELQSLVGLLQHATKVVKPGRSFMRRIHALLAQDGGHIRPDHFIRLNIATRADILWWQTFIEEWNGISLMWVTNTQEPDIRVVSDASGSWGCGAHCLPQWFAFQWTPELRTESIQVKELFPVVAAAALFGRQWKGKVVQFVVDNKAVVDILKEGYSRESHLMHMIRMLVFFACHFQFWWTAEHIPGRENTLADAISRNNLELFLTQASPTPGEPAIVPSALADMLSQNTTWTSTNWIPSFKNIIQQL